MQDSISNDRDDVALDVMVFSSYNLFETQDPFVELPEASMWMQDRELEINFGTTDYINAPLGVMVPNLLVPMMERFRSKKLQ